VGACGDGMAEFASMFSNFYVRLQDGAFPLPALPYPNRPHPNSGHTVYDICKDCDGIAWLIVVVWIALIWITLPIIEYLRWHGYISKQFWKEFLSWIKSIADSTPIIKMLNAIIARSSSKNQNKSELVVKFNPNFRPPREHKTNGSYNEGDIIWNIQPRMNSYVGWVCIQTGSPGLWSPFGKIGNS
jgi:hypothetical protein